MMMRSIRFVTPSSSPWLPMASDSESSACDLHADQQTLLSQMRQYLRAICTQVRGKHLLPIREQVSNKAPDRRTGIYDPLVRGICSAGLGEQIVTTSSACNSHAHQNVHAKANSNKASWPFGQSAMPIEIVQFARKSSTM